MTSVVLRRFPSVYRELKNVLFITGPRRCNSSVADSAPQRPYLKSILTGVGCGIVAGGFYTYVRTYLDKQPSLVTPVKVSSSLTLETVPDVQISRKIVIPKDLSGLEITLFQYPTCPFCCKVRAFLDYYGLSYNVVEVNPVLRQQIKWSSYKKVPIILIKDGGEYVQLNDSTMIISALSTYLKNSHSSIKEITQYYPTSFESEGNKSDIVNKYFLMDGSVDQKQLEIDKDERKWRKWADDVLVHTLSPNVYRTKDEALEAFQWFSEVGEWESLFSRWEQVLVIYVGAYAMWMIGKKLKKRHNLKENVRESLYDECRIWVSEVKKRGKFFGGANPNLADLAVYGVLCSIEGCRAFKDLLENTKIGGWYNDMKDVVQSHSGLRSPR